MPEDYADPNEDENEEDDEGYEFEHCGLTITLGPGWYDVSHGREEGEESDEEEGGVEEDASEEGEDDSDHNGPLILAKKNGAGFLQISVQTEDQKSIPAGALRQWLLDVSKEMKLGPGYDLVELKTKSALILGCSFRPDGEFQRLWYWTDRRRLVLVVYWCNGEPDPDELRECAAVVSRLRVERD